MAFSEDAHWAIRRSVVRCEDCGKVLSDTVEHECPEYPNRVIRHLVALAENHQAPHEQGCGLCAYAREKRNA